MLRFVFGVILAWIWHHIAIASISFAKSEILASETKTIFCKNLHRKNAKLHQTLCILPKTSTSISIIGKANWLISLVLKWHIPILYLRCCCMKSRPSNLMPQAYFFVPDQSGKQAFEMRFCSVILIKLKYVYLQITSLKTCKTIAIF